MRTGVAVILLFANQAIHTHHRPKPIEAAQWRIMPPWGVCRNLRLGEIVFHGELLGCSHRDGAAWFAQIRLSQTPELPAKP
jgi:hypothetical protein